MRLDRAHVLQIREYKNIAYCVHAFGGTKSPKWGGIILEDHKRPNFSSTQNLENPISDIKAHHSGSNGMNDTSI